MNLRDLTDVQFLRQIGLDDLRTAENAEANAAGWCRSTEPSAALAEEYQRRYGRPLPQERPTTWAMYHCPVGFLWQVTLRTRPDPSRPWLTTQVEAEVTAYGETLPAAHAKAERELQSLVAVMRGKDSGLREYCEKLERVS